MTLDNSRWGQTFDMVVNLTGPLPSPNPRDWPSMVREKFEKEIEDFKARQGCDLKVASIRSDVDHETGIWFLHAVLFVPFKGPIQ